MYIDISTTIKKIKTYKHTYYETNLRMLLSQRITLCKFVLYIVGLTQNTILVSLNPTILCE